MERWEEILGHSGLLSGLGWVPAPCLSHTGQLGALLPHRILHPAPSGGGEPLEPHWACATSAGLAGLGVD